MNNEDTTRLNFIIKTGCRIVAFQYTSATVDGVEVYTPIYGIDLGNGQVYHEEGKSVRQMIDDLNEKYQKGHH